MRQEIDYRVREVITLCAKYLGPESPHVHWSFWRLLRRRRMLKKRLMKSRYKLMAAIMYSSGESRPLIKYVS